MVRRGLGLRDRRGSRLDDAGLEKWFNLEKKDFLSNVLKKSMKNQISGKKIDNSSFGNWCNITTCHGMYDWYNATTWLTKVTNYSQVKFSEYFLI